MVLGIPIDWDRKLIDIYIENYREFKYIPHLECNGKICLFDLEGVLIDKNFQGLLIQSLNRAYEVIWKGINELNKEDFIEEFEQYWGRLPNTKILKSMINSSKDIKLIKYADNQKKVIKRNGDNYIDVKRKMSQYSIVCSDSVEDFRVYEDMKNIRNGIYLYIETDTFIFPPDWRASLDIEYINTLLKNKSIEKRKLASHIKKCGKDLLMVFKVKQPNECVNIFAVLIKGYIFDESSNKINLLSNSELIPCWAIRCDKEFLVNRGGALSYISDKKILVIGCGSIGSYLINELVKTGINNIDIVDGDLLNEENIYRHLLGMEYVGNYKTTAIADFFNKNIPGLNIVSYSDYIEDAINDSGISLSEYDLVISAVGNHNLNRWINESMHIEEIKVPVIYSWNEVLGIGNHVAFISSSHKGCYECFFGNSKESIYDKTSYCEKGQTFIKRVRGCSSAYLPFSSTNSITTVITAMEVVRKYFEGRIKENLLISIKGDNYYFKKAGLKTSNRYDKQSEINQIIEGKKFMNDYCVVCGGN